MMYFSRRSPAALLSALVLAAGACMPAPTLVPVTAAHDTASDSPANSDHPAPKPYDQVITRDAKTRRGMFAVHRVGDKLYFEIPRRELNTDMLLVGRFARAATIDASNPFGAYGGDEFGERTLRWERAGDRIILRSPSFAIMADSTLPIYKAVEAGNYAPIVGVFDVAAWGKDSAAVIDVTRLYTSDVPEFAAIHGSIDEKRSYVESAVAFPDNVEIEATETGTQTSSGPISRGPSESGATSVLAHWSMVRLPAHPMTPRLADERVGFFGVTRTNYGTREYRSVEEHYIARWRLECSDSVVHENGRTLCIPKQPIVYYVDAATPDQWKPWIKRAVLEWEPAFEAAGFTNAIVARDEPTNDPDWSPDDVHHTVIRWLPSTNENAIGPHISDPRTGEILNGSIRLFHNVLNLQRDWYFTQVAPLDARAQRWPMPDSLMGAMLQYVVAHEIGHTLGLYHNHKASSMYPADSVRSRTWVHTMGHVPSIMDYARFNYVAQPEDSIDVNDLIPRVGPYDRFAIMWGYTPIHGATTPEAERPALDSIARMQDSVPWLRFGNLAESAADNPDAGDEMEAVGDQDAVKSTGYGLRNIERIMPMLLRVTQKPGEDNADLEEIYDRLVSQWATEMLHVVNVVGGATSHIKYGGQPGPIYTPEPAANQRAAVAFLSEHVFRTPTFFLDPAVTRRIEADGSLDRIGAAQRRVLRGLLSDGRMARMVEYEALAPRSGSSARDVYTLPEMLRDVRTGVWTEIADRSVATDAFRRNLQRMYLDAFDAELNRKGPEPGTVIILSSGDARPADLGNVADIRADMRAELVTLRASIDAAIPHAVDGETRAHLLESRTRIDRILDPNK